MARSRSPNYPSTSLAEALAKVRVIYDKDYRNRMGRSVVAKHLGYQSLNGASLTAISNLIKYGLLEGRGDEMQVTNDAVTILVEPELSKERLEAIRRAGFKPALFSQIHKQFGESLPSAENLSAYLQRNGFNPSAAGAATRSYRDTFNLVSSESKLYDNPAKAILDAEAGMEAQIQGRDDSDEVNYSFQRTAPDGQVLSDLISFNVPFRGQPMSVQIRRPSGRLSRQHIERVIEYLKLTASDMPEWPEGELPKQNPPGDGND